jgi:hypothetical protein
MANDLLGLPLPLAKSFRGEKEAAGVTLHIHFINHPIHSGTHYTEPNFKTFKGPRHRFRGIESLLKLFPARESFVSNIPAGDRKKANLFLQCSSTREVAQHL